MAKELEGRGLEVFMAILLLIGKANIVATTLNKQSGIFTLNVGSEYFIWRKPAATLAAPKATSPGKENAEKEADAENLSINRILEAILDKEDFYD